MYSQQRAAYLHNREGVRGKLPVCPRRLLRQLQLAPLMILISHLPDDDPPPTQTAGWTLLSILRIPKSHGRPDSRSRSVVLKKSRKVNSNDEWTKRFDELKRAYDELFAMVFEEIRELKRPARSKRKPVGFLANIPPKRLRPKKAKGGLVDHRVAEGLVVANAQCEGADGGARVVLLFRS